MKGPHAIGLGVPLIIQRGNSTWMSDSVRVSREKPQDPVLSRREELFQGAELSQSKLLKTI